MALKSSAVVIISFSYTDEKILEILFHLDFFKRKFPYAMYNINSKQNWKPRTIWKEFK